LAGWGGDLSPSLEFEVNAQSLAVGTQEHKTEVKKFIDKEQLAFRWPVNKEKIGT
jgi:2-(1,2-epoxy-1,2-dihydrophenyl)acetyl-CoA isomerase